MNAGALFAPVYAAVLALVAFEYLRPAKLRAARRAFASSATPYVIALVLAYAATLAVVWYAATTTRAPQPWRAGLPFPVVTRDAANAQLVSLAMLLLAGLQCTLLLAIYRRAVTRTVTVAAAIVIVALSIAAPALISLDAYSYAADAALGLSAYSANPAFPNGVSIVVDAFGGPPPPAPYGPLWIAIAWVVTAAFSSLTAKVVALRVFGALLVAAFVAGLRALGMPARVLAVAALNPAIALQYVANAHNDLFCAACVVWAAVLVRRSRVAALCAVVAAALVKAPFALLAWPVFRRAPHRGSMPGSTLARIALAVGAVVVTAIASYSIGGTAYVRAVTVHLPNSGALGTVAAVAALVALVMALFLAGRRRGVVWLLPLAGSYPAPWYGLWGAGYATSSRRVMGYLLVFLPLAATLVDTMFLQLWWLLAIVPLLVAFEVLRER